LHLTPTRLKWPQRFFKRHGDKTVFLARFIPVLPSAVATLLEGTTTISWPTYLWLNLAGAAAYTTVYILLGYFLGKKWQLSASMVRADGALCNHGCQRSHRSRVCVPQNATSISRTLFAHRNLWKCSLRYKATKDSMVHAARVD
jgi:hypothetical protein